MTVFEGMPLIAGRVIGWLPTPSALVEGIRRRGERLANVHALYAFLAGELPAVLERWRSEHGAGA